MKNGILFLLLMIQIINSSQAMSSGKSGLIIANPMNLNYQFQPKDRDLPRREAADPACEYFNGYYWLFASKSNGYWRSENLADWEYIPCTSIDIINDYAPTILVYDDALYFTASSDGNPTRIFKTKNPGDGASWQEIECKISYIHQHDPSFFKDDDGRVYFYWGCSDVNPIIGVEVDPNDGFKAIGEPVELIGHNRDKYGWEQFGENNEEDSNGWNEGPAVIKANGKYYLQYASNGTQFRTYCDGVYIGESPLGPFEYMEDSPFSIKPGGFIGAAGHGHTFKDKYGNYWHVASMLVGVRHWYERRLGLFPVFIEGDNMWSATVFSDYPFYVPLEKINVGSKKIDDKLLSLGWRQLALDKDVYVSSEGVLDKPSEKYGTVGLACYATDEKVETWWTAETGNAGEWLTVDLGSVYDINAIQVNFSDEGAKALIGEKIPHQYILEISADNINWEIFSDKSNNKEDLPHELVLAHNPGSGRYVRITNVSDLPCKFSIMDLRVFGQDTRGKLDKVRSFKAKRNPEDPRRYSFKWKPVKNADGYILRWGLDKDNLTHSIMVRDTKYEAGYFNRDSKYYFSIEAF